MAYFAEYICNIQLEEVLRLGFLVCLPKLAFAGFLPLFPFIPKPPTLSLAKPEVASIATGASALIPA